jgi:hypothetical protein
MFQFVVLLLKRELPPSLAGDTEKPLGIGGTFQ